MNNSDKAHKVPWGRYAEINSELSVGRDVLTGESVDMTNLTVEPMTSIVVEFSR